MAPPPPSKSYLWTLFDDDDSSTASSSSSMAASKQELCRVDKHKQSFQSSNNSNSTQGRNVESSTITSTALDTRTNSQQRKHKNSKRKNKKKNKTSQQQQTTKTTTSTTANTLSCRVNKVVVFDRVEIREFRRCLGEGVPADGGWPLGLEQIMNDACDLFNTTIQDYETTKQERLRNRWLELNPDESRVPETTLETRPFDYKRNVTNPLFRPLSEQQRMKVLLSSSSSDHEVIHLPSSPQNSLATAVSKRRIRSKSVTDEYSDDFPHMQVLHVRNELETVRTSRSLEGHAGCTCRKLHVHLLPPTGGGKKAHSRRISLLKVKEELRKRHQLPEQHQTRDELELLLHNIVADEPCCWSQDCACANNGINCQVDTCSCWLASHADDKQATNRVPPAEIKERCGNKYGMYAIDADQVDADRKHQIMMYCQEIGREQHSTQKSG